MTVGGQADTVFCFNKPCKCHLYTAPRNKSVIYLPLGVIITIFWMDKDLFTYEELHIT
jgi:hypothetical protein